MNIHHHQILLQILHLLLKKEVQQKKKKVDLKEYVKHQQFMNHILQMN